MTIAPRAGVKASRIGRRERDTCASSLTWRGVFGHEEARKLPVLRRRLARAPIGASNGSFADGVFDFFVAKKE